MQNAYRRVETSGGERDNKPADRDRQSEVEKRVDRVRRVVRISPPTSY